MAKFGRKTQESGTDNGICHVERHGKILGKKASKIDIEQLNQRLEELADRVERLRRTEKMETR